MNFYSFQVSERRFWFRLNLRQIFRPKITLPNFQKISIPIQIEERDGVLTPACTGDPGRPKWTPGQDYHDEDDEDDDKDEDDDDDVEC